MSNQTVARTQKKDAINRPEKLAQNVVFETERLRFATWSRDDWKEFGTLASDPLVVRYVSARGEPWSDERVQEFVNRQMEHWEKHRICLWKLLPKENDELIGICGLQHLPEGPDVEIGWWLAPSHWGKGIATEAATQALAYGFDVCNFERIVAIAQSVNLDSLRVMDRLGMRFEREAVHKGLHVVLYAITREHFAVLRSERNQRA
jgi:RimJ/RimL family protein N-acetyltransferase